MQVHLAEDLRRGIQRSKCLSVIVDGQEVTFLGTGDYFGEVPPFISKVAVISFPCEYALFF